MGYIADLVVIHQYSSYLSHDIRWYFEFDFLLSRIFSLINTARWSERPMFGTEMSKGRAISIVRHFPSFFPSLQCQAGLILHSKSV